MIYFEDWIIRTDGEILARQFDDRSRRLSVSGQLPRGWTWAMLVKVGDAMDILSLEETREGLSTVLTAEQLSVFGYYKIQLRGTQGNVVRHTNIINVYIPASLSGDAQWPIVPSEFSDIERRINEKVSEVEGYSAHPPIIGENGNWWEWDGSAYVDTGKASQGMQGPQGPAGPRNDSLYRVGKNVFNVDSVLRNGDGTVDAATGKIVDGTQFVYGYFSLSVEQTYTVSKTGRAVFLNFYNEDSTFAGAEKTIALGGGDNTKTFTAEHPKMVVSALADAAGISLQIEQGNTATEYEPYCLTLNDNVLIPCVGEGTLNTAAKTVIPAINELHGITARIFDIEEDVQNVSADVMAIEKVLPRLNEGLTGWTYGFVGTDGTIASSTGWLYSNKVLLLAGKTYHVQHAYIDYTVYFDADGNFLGRGSSHSGVSQLLINNYEGTVTVGETDVYAVFQTITSKYQNVYCSRFVNEKASAKFCENLLINKNLMDKKVLILGDSISTGDTSAKVHAGEKYGDYNKWVEQLIAENFLADHMVRNDSIHATGFVARFNGEDDLITRLRKTPDTDYDLVIVFAGINDSLRADSISVGFGMDENGNKETDITRYFVPAVDTFFAELTEKFVNARICVVLPLRTKYKYAGHNISSPGTLYDGSTARLESDYADYIAKVAEEYCLPVLDATRHSGFAPFLTAFAERWMCRAERGNGDTTLVPDGVHPNEEYCQKYLSKYIRGFIDGLI